jgi:molybdopterin-containing oxidoreductase family membrane subunit
MIESSSFFDGVIHPYTPSVPEVLLGLGGMALAATIVAVALRALALLPARLDQVAGSQA